MYSMSNSCKSSAYSCIGAKISSLVLFVLFIVEILATTSFVGLKQQTRKDENEKIADMIPMEQIVIGDRNPVFIPRLPLHKTHQVLDANSCGVKNIVQFPHNSTQIAMPPDPVSTVHTVYKTLQLPNTSISLVGPRISTNKVESNENVVARDQTSGNISDPASLLHQPLIEGQEKNNFHIEHPNNFLPESAEHPPQKAAVVESHAQVPELKTIAKVSYWVLPISDGGIASILAGIIGDKKTDLAHKVVLFNAYKSLTFISFVLSVLLFLLTILKLAHITRLVVIVKITIWLTLGSITYAITYATFIILVNNLIDVAIVLVVPLVIVLVLVIVNFSSHKA